MRNPNGPSIEEKEAMQEHLEDLNEMWRNQLCAECHLARKIVVGGLLSTDLRGIPWTPAIEICEAKVADTRFTQDRRSMRGSHE